VRRECRHAIIAGNEELQRLVGRDGIREMMVESRATLVSRSAT
jgi:hypothetical protein